MQPAPPPGDAPDIYVRFPVKADRDAYRTLLASSQHHLAPWWSTPPGNDADPWAAECWFDRFLATSRLESSLRFFITHRPSNIIMGSVSISMIVKGAFQSCTLGYWIAAPYANRGFTTHAVALAVHFALQTIGLHRCEANIVPDNHLSIRLITRLGFRNEGTARNYLRINFSWRDHTRFALTREDYLPLVASRTFPFSQDWALRLPT